MLFLILIAGAVGIAVWLALRAQSQPTDWDIALVTRPAARELREKLLELTIAIASEHARALFIKSKQLVSVDAYGTRDASRFYDEIRYFITEIITRDERFLVHVRTDPHLARLAVSSLCGMGNGTLAYEMGEEILGIVQTYGFISGKLVPDLENVSPIEFEILCAERMKANGWDAQLTKGSGDQGADVICHRDQLSLVLQCKLYSSPIGNSGAGGLRSQVILRSDARCSGQQSTLYEGGERTGQDDWGVAAALR